jgi:hypothetical protein
VLPRPAVFVLLNWEEMLGFLYSSQGKVQEVVLILIFPAVLFFPCFHLYLLPSVSRRKRFSMGIPGPLVCILDYSFSGLHFMCEASSYVESPKR